MEDSSGGRACQAVESLYPGDRSEWRWDERTARWIEVREDGAEVAKHFRKIDDRDRPRPIAIKPFVRLGDCVFLVGERGQGKTTFAADMLRAYGFAAAGDENTEPEWYDFAGGAFQVQPEYFRGRPAVILDGENEPADWQDVLTQTLRAYGLNWKRPEMARFRSELLYHLDSTRFPLCPLSYPKEHKKTREALVKELRARNAGLLIIDPLHAVYGRRAIEKSEWAREGLEALRHDLRAFDCTLLLLAHPSRYYPDKPSQNLFLPSGTSAQEGLADVILGIWRPPQGRAKNMVKLELVKRRAAKWNLERSKCVLRGTRFDAGFTACQSEWLFDDPRTGGPDIALSHGEQHVLFSCPDDREFTYSDLETERSQSSRIIRKVFKEFGLVECTGGSGKKGDPQRWKLTEKGIRTRDWYLEENKVLAAEMGLDGGNDG